MTKLSYQDLNDKMISANSTSTTQGWDVLCAYDVTKVNKIFVREHVKNPLSSSTQFKVEQSFPHTKITQEYDIKFGDPSITFLAGQNGVCKVELPISKGSTVITTVNNEPPDSGTIPQGYSITMTVPLANISGDTVKKSGGVVVFDNQGESKDQSIVLHFNTKEGIGDTIAYEPPTEDKDIQSALDGLVTGFKQNIQDVDYCITTVKQATTSPASGVKLTPKSFIFTTYTEGTASGELRVWIQTNESGNDVGIHPDPVFQIGTDRYCVIPESCTASIIFAQQVVKDKYLTPALNSAFTSVSWADTNPYDSTEKVGIGVKLSFAKYTKSFPDYNVDLQDFYKYDDLVVNYDSTPIFLNLLRDTVHIKWDYAQDLSCEQGIINARTGISYKQAGEIHITSSVDKTCHITLVQSATDGPTIQVDGSVSSSDMQISTNYVHHTSFWDYLFGIFGEDNQALRDNIHTSLYGLNNFTIDCGALSFFAEANIIFDGPVFHSKDVSFNGDVLLIGDITEVD